MKAELHKMMTLYQVDAFTSHLFKGNPAAVVPLKQWLPNATMQSIAMENNLAETAFFIPKGDDYELRWFTPLVEVDLCGHATLATAKVLFDEMGRTGNVVHFHTKSGLLSVYRKNDFLTLNFPTDDLKKLDDIPVELLYGIGVPTLEAYKGVSDLLVLVKDEDELLSIRPELSILSKIPVRGIIVTAPGNEVDFVSRFFAPNAGINEDPVTGSAHTSLTPYWATRLGKTSLKAKQLSTRGGYLLCEFKGNRVEISGQAKLYMKGHFYWE